MKSRARTYIRIFIASFIFYMILFVATPLVTSEAFASISPLLNKIFVLLSWMTNGILSCVIFGTMAMIAYTCNIFIYGTLRMVKSNALRIILIAIYAALDVAIFFGLKAIIATGTVWPMLRFMVHLLLFFHVVFFVKWAAVAYCRNQKVPETSEYYKG